MLKLLIIFSFGISVMSCWQRDDLATDMNLLPEINNEPIQKKLTENEFSVRVNEITYIVQPQYAYELYGMVVSYSHHDGDYGLHKLWNDHLNVADVCVIWGESAFNRHIDKFNFWNGQFTCNVSTQDNLAWSSFNMNQLSNNHLISERDLVRDKIKGVAVGDQIRIKGRLASYGEDVSKMRRTSTVRTDTGNGACETIYVDDFEILESYTSGWRKLMYLSLTALLLLLIFYFMSPYKPSNR